MEVDLETDTLHTLHVIVFSADGRYALSTIPSGKLYSGKLGSTATIVMLHNEVRDSAAKRALAKELSIHDSEPEYLGEKLYSFDDGITRLITAYMHTYSEESIVVEGQELVYMTRSELLKRITDVPDAFAPTFLGIWKTYHMRFPF